MSRRTQAGPGADAGNDSFLDILANLVGILVILVVVVSIRVQQTVRVDRDVSDVPQVIETTVEPEIVTPEPIILGPEDLPINVSFAAPVAEVEAEPTASQALIAKRNELQASIANLRPLPINRSSGDVAELESEAALLRNQIGADRELVSQIKATLEARRDEYSAIQNDIGRAVHDLEQEVPPETHVVSLHHDVRAIARVAGPDQIYIELAENYVTVLPIKKLLPKLGADIRRKVKTARVGGLYDGRVGPIDGVSLFYELKRGGASPIDELRYGSSAPITQQLTFTVDIGDEALSEPVDDALRGGSEFQFALMRALPGTSVTAFVYPDSFHAARKIQEHLQSQGVRLAMQPLPKGVPIIHSPDGAKAMAQ